MKVFFFRSRIITAALLASALIYTIPNATAGTSLAADSARTELQASLDVLAQRASPGLLGITVLDLHSGTEWRVNADRAYPMMSVFKAPVAAVVLSRIDEGTLSLEQKVILTRADLQEGSAVPSIGAHFHGERMTFTVRQLLVAAVSESDSTAADALVKLVGGPAVVTGFLQKHGIEGMRVDLDEAGISHIFGALRSGEVPPANESAQQKLQRYRLGYQAFLADPRNRSTPDAAVAFLGKLWGHELLSSASTTYLIDLMTKQTVPNRLRAGLPDGIRLADKCGTADGPDDETAAYNDIGIMTWPDGRTVIVAAFLTASRDNKSRRDAIFADIARDIAADLHP